MMPGILLVSIETLYSCSGYCASSPVMSYREDYYRKSKKLTSTAVFLGPKADDSPGFNL